MGCILGNRPKIHLTKSDSLFSFTSFKPSKSEEIKSLSKLKLTPGDFVTEGIGKITHEYILSKNTLAIGNEI